MTTAVLAVAIVIIVFSCLCVCAAVAFGAYRIYKALKAVGDGITKLNDQMSGVPAILEGLTNICKELSSYTVNVGGSVDKLRTTLFAGGKSEVRRDKESFQPYTDESADQEWKIREAMAAYNIPRQQAHDAVVAGLDEERFVVGE